MSALVIAMPLLLACTAMASAMRVTTDRVEITQGQMTADFSTGTVTISGFQAKAKNGETISKFLAKVWIDKNKNGISDKNEPVVFEFIGSSGTSQATIAAAAVSLPSNMSTGDTVMCHIEVKGDSAGTLYSTTQPIAYHVQ
jgi:hypothetical protein